MAGDPPEHDRRAGNEHDDGQRRMEHEPLELRGQEAGEGGGTEHYGDDRSGDEEDLAPTGRPRRWRTLRRRRLRCRNIRRLIGARHRRSASDGMPIGATSTRPASALPNRVWRPVLGRWKVIVRSARTTGSEG